MNYLNLRDTRDLTPAHLTPIAQNKLDRFLKGLFVGATIPPRPGRPMRFRKLTKIVPVGADQYKFTNDKTGENLSVTVSLLITALLIPERPLHSGALSQGAPLQRETRWCRLCRDCQGDRIPDRSVAGAHSSST
jgi:hypothetical protein